MMFNKVAYYKRNNYFHHLGSVHGEKVVLGDIPPKWKNVEISIDSDMLPRRWNWYPRWWSPVAIVDYSKSFERKRLCCMVVFLSNRMYDHQRLQQKWKKMNMGSHNQVLLEASTAIIRMNNWRLFQLGVNSEEKVGNIIFYACLPQNPRWSNIENLRFCSSADMLSAAHPECNKIEKPSEK